MESYNQRGCYEILMQFIEEPECLIEDCESKEEILLKIDVWNNLQTSVIFYETV